MSDMNESTLLIRFWYWGFFLDIAPVNDPRANNDMNIIGLDTNRPMIDHTIYPIEIIKYPIDGRANDKAFDGSVSSILTSFSVS